MKDYYKILGVKPSATFAEIKKAYRSLAFQYHPDKNPDSHLAEAQFKEVQEAYATVSDPQRRERYDDERWLMGMGSKTQYKEAITPAWLLNVCKQLNASLAVMDTHRMSQRTLKEYILLILTDAHLGVLEHHADKAVNEAIIKELIRACNKLEIKYVDEINTRLILIAGADNDLKQTIYTNAEDRAWKAKQEKYLPFFIIIITLMLCVFMYLYAGWK